MYKIGILGIVTCESSFMPMGNKCGNHHHHNHNVELQMEMPQNEATNEDAIKLYHYLLQMYPYKYLL